MTVETPSAIRSFIDSTNEEDTERFVATFAPDATIDDWGRRFEGADGIASWNQTDNIGKHSRFDVVEVAEGDGPGRFVVTVDVAGEGFTGLGTMTFTIEGDVIASLVIT